MTKVRSLETNFPENSKTWQNMVIRKKKKFAALSCLTTLIFNHADSFCWNCTVMKFVLKITFLSYTITVQP